jgi:hypothetical protein
MGKQNLKLVKVVRTQVKSSVERNAFLVNGEGMGQHATALIGCHA